MSACGSTVAGGSGGGSGTSAGSAGDGGTGGGTSTSTSTSSSSDGGSTDSTSTSSISGSTTGSGATTTLSWTNPACAPSISGVAGGGIVAAAAFPGLEILHLAVDGAGDALFLASFLGQVTVGGVTYSQVGGADPSQADVLLVKLDPCGQVAWVKQLGTAVGDIAKGLAVTASGDVLVSVRSYGVGLVSTELHRFDSQGQALWSTEMTNLLPGGDHPLVATPDGGALIGGVTLGAVIVGSSEIEGNPEDALVLKLDANGELVWGAWAGFPAFPGAPLLAATGDGGAFLVGQAGGKLVVKRLDSTGAVVWSQETTGSGSAESLVIGVDGQGDVFLSGRYQGAMDFGFGNPAAEGVLAGFVLSLDGQTGIPAWAHALSPSADPTSQLWSNTVAPAADGAALTLGSYHGVFDIDGLGQLPGSPEIRMYGVRYTKDGAIDWVVTNPSASQVSAIQAEVGPDGRVWAIFWSGGPLTLADGTVVDEPGSLMVQIAP